MSLVRGGCGAVLVRVLGVPAAQHAHADHLIQNEAEAAGRMRRPAAAQKRDGREDELQLVVPHPVTHADGRLDETLPHDHR